MRLCSSNSLRYRTRMTTWRCFKQIREEESLNKFTCPLIKDHKTWMILVKFKTSTTTSPSTPAQIQWLTMWQTLSSRDNWACLDLSPSLRKRWRRPSRGSRTARWAKWANRGRFSRCFLWTSSLQWVLQTWRCSSQWEVILAGSRSTNCSKSPASQDLDNKASWLTKWA